MILWSFVACVCVARLVSTTAADGLTLEAAITVAAENGPVVLEYRLVNRGPTARDVLVEGCGMRYRSYSLCYRFFSGPVVPDLRPAPLSALQYQWGGGFSGLNRSTRLNPRDGLTIRR